MLASWYEPHIVTPGAKERIEQKLKKLKEINENRPCKTCANNQDAGERFVSRSCRTCNFNHDNYEPK